VPPVDPPRPAAEDVTGSPGSLTVRAREVRGFTSIGTALLFFSRAPPAFRHADREGDRRELPGVGIGCDGDEGAQDRGMAVRWRRPRSCIEELS
jgi:hypothetical protein